MVYFSTKIFSASFFYVFICGFWKVSFELFSPLKAISSFVVFRNFHFLFFNPSFSRFNLWYYSGVILPVEIFFILFYFPMGISNGASLGVPPRYFFLCRKIKSDFPRHNFGKPNKIAIAQVKNETPIRKSANKNLKIHKWKTQKHLQIRV